MQSITYENRVDFDLDTPSGMQQAKEITTKAVDITRIYLNTVDETCMIDEIHTQDRLMVDVHFTGKCAGSEPLGLTWTRDLELPL